MIARGAYGTVFQPPINQSNQPKENANKKMVGKVVISDYKHRSFSIILSDADKEWSNRTLLRSLDPNQVHFVYPTSRQEIDVHDYNKYVKKPINDAPEGTTLTQFIMIDAGTSLRRQAKESRLTLQKILDYSLQVAEGIQTLLQDELVHLDIHLGNMVSNAEGRCRLVDFGLMMCSGAFYTHHNTLWREVYAISPPEFRLLQCSRMKYNTLKQEQTLLATYIGIYPDGLDHVFQKPVFKKSYHYLQTTMASLNEKTQRMDYLREHNAHEKVDIYGLGVSIIEMLSYVDEPNLSTKLVSKIWDIITMMIMPHPDDRMDINAFISSATQLLNDLHQEQNMQKNERSSRRATR